jgi:molybdopterin synthase sulfur carrier subunit
VKITIKFLSYLHTTVGVKMLERDVAPSLTLDELLQILKTEFPQLARTIPNLTVTLNRQIVPPQIRLKEGDEVALFPPVSGG